MSVAKAAECGKTAEFTDRTCYIVGPRSQVGTRVGSIYYLDSDNDYHARVAQETNVSGTSI